MYTALGTLCRPQLEAGCRMKYKRPWRLLTANGVSQVLYVLRVLWLAWLTTAFAAGPLRSVSAREKHKQGLHLPNEGFRKVPTQSNTTPCIREVHFTLSPGLPAAY